MDRRWIGDGSEIDRRCGNQVASDQWEDILEKLVLTVLYFLFALLISIPMAKLTSFQELFFFIGIF